MAAKVCVRACVRVCMCALMSVNRCIRTRHSGVVTMKLNYLLGNEIGRLSPLKHAQTISVCPNVGELLYGVFLCRESFVLVTSVSTTSSLTHSLTHSLAAHAALYTSILCMYVCMHVCTLHSPPLPSPPYKYEICCTQGKLRVLVAC